MPYTVQCRSYSKKTVNQLYIYFTVLGAAIKCKLYSEITVESVTHVKTVKNTLNIFAVFSWLYCALYLYTYSWSTDKVAEYLQIKCIRNWKTVKKCILGSGNFGTMYFGRGICGSFFLWLSTSRSQVVMKKSSNDEVFTINN